MITKDQAVKLSHRDELHFGECKVQIGENGGVHITQTKARVNGQTKIWKTKPEQFQVPIKHGMYQTGYLHDRNASDFHLASECALVTDPWLKMMCTPIIGNADDDSKLMEDLRWYIMDSRNDLEKRAGAVRRLDYVVGVHPPRVTNMELVRGAVCSFYKDCYDGDLDELLENFPHLEPIELTL